MGDTRVLFLHMPMAVPSMPNLAVETLRQVAAHRGFPSDVLYGTLRLESTPELPVYLHNPLGQVIFNPGVGGKTAAESVRRTMNEPECRQELAEAHSRHLRDTQGKAPSSWSRRTLRNSLIRHHEAAEKCLEQCLGDIPPGRYQAFAFSLAFDSQKLASLALARRLKEREPQARVLFGGTACDGPMGPELMRAFPFLDAVAQGDADLTIGPILSALLGLGNWEEADGVVYRQREQVRSNPPAAPLSQLDRLPVPDYGEFLRQLARSDFAEERPFILFEGSRGCWWGEKHHCPFCGLRADGLAFRRKSPQRTYDEILHLARRYPGHRRLYATDAILDHRNFRELLPRLRDLGDQPVRRLFFELKSNLKKRDVALLAESGVRSVQPGIESFGDHVLELMDKGNKGLKHVQLIKWLTEYGLETIYNLIVGSPGESVADYQEMTHLIPALHHLPPPRQISLLNLDRFSPYFEQAARFGIENIRPSATARTVYEGLPVDLDKLLYQFEYDSAAKEDRHLAAAWRRLEEALRDWQDLHQRRGLWLRRGSNDLLLIEEKDGQRSSTRLMGLQAALYQACDGVRSYSQLRRQFPHIAPAALRLSLERWVSRGWAYRSEDSYLALALDLKPPTSYELEVSRHPASSRMPAAHAAGQSKARPLQPEREASG